MGGMVQMNKIISIALSLLFLPAIILLYLISRKQLKEYLYDFQVAH
jgi:hypothetical protein